MLNSVTLGDTCIDCQNYVCPEVDGVLHPGCKIRTDGCVLVFENPDISKLGFCHDFRRESNSRRHKY